MAETQNSKQNVQAPQAGQTVIVNAIPGQDIVLEAAFDQAEVKMDGGNVVFEFANGGQVVLDFTDLGDAQAPNVVMPDGTVLDMQEFLASLGEKDVEPAAGPDGGATGSGGVGEYQDDAGDLLGGTDKLGGLEDDPFPSLTLASIDSVDDNPLPSAGIVGGAVDEDGLRLSEGAHFDGNDDEAGGDNPARFSYLDGTLNYDFGGDGPADTTPFAWSLANLPVVFSEGNQLVYEVVDGGLTLNAYYMTEVDPYNPPQGEGEYEYARVGEGPERIDVFSLKLTDLDNGTFRFELYQPLDHSDTTTEDDINYGFTFTVTDGSGDSVVGGLNLAIDDDSPVVSADESDLPEMILDESSFGSGIVDAPQESANSTIASAINLDGHFTLGSNPDVANSESTPFVSINAVGNNGYDYYSFTVTQPNTTVVFDIDYASGAGSSFDSTLRLYDSVGTNLTYSDDADTSLGGGGSVSGLDSYLTWTFSTPGTYYVQVGQWSNGPISGNGSYQLQISLPNAIMGGGEGDGIRALTTDFSGNFDFNFGADGPEGEGVNYALSLGAESIESGIFALGENGQPGEQIMLSLDESGTIIGTTEGSSPYFSISVDAETGKVTFVQYQNVFHPDADNHDDAVSLDLLQGSILLTATATDGDGDSSSATLDLSSGIFGIEDDGPSVVGEPEVGTIDEANIETDYSVGTEPGGGPALISGSLAGLVDFGTDGQGHFAFTDDAAAQLEALGLASKQSFFGLHSVALEYSVSQDGVFSVLTATEPDINPWSGDTSNPVFELRLNTVTGEYEFRLYDELVHPKDQQDDVIDIDFGSMIQAVDADGDSVVLGEAFTIKVQDDEPIANDDSHVISEDTRGWITGDVTTNDVDGADESLDFKGWNEVSVKHGTFWGYPDGSYSYNLDNVSAQKLDDGESWTETITYKVKDTDGDIDTATLTITIEGRNDQPTISVKTGNRWNADDVVDEAAMDEHGSHPGSNAEYAYGTFKVADPDGLDDIKSVTINGQTFLITDLVDQTVNGDSGTLTITSYNSATGVAEYKYVLEEATTDVPHRLEVDKFTLTTSDGDWSSAKAYINIEIDDDQPYARTDTDLVAFVASGEGFERLAEGNVLTGVGTTSGSAGADIPGADQPAVVSSVGFDANDSGYVGSSERVDVGVSGASIDGKHGTLTINPDGSYTYEVDPEKLPEPTTTTVTDGSGVTVKAFQLGESIFNAAGKYNAADGDTDDVTDGGNFPAKGVDSGAADNALSAPDQVNYAGSESEALAFEFDGPVSSATITVSNLFNDERGGEAARWHAFDANGVRIATGIISNNASSSVYASTTSVDWDSNNVGTFTVSDIGTFTTLVIEALPYSNDGFATNDDSDFFATIVSYDALPDNGTAYSDVFKYWIKDADGDYSSANLIITGVEPNPAGEFVNQAPVGTDNDYALVDSSIEGNIITDDNDGEGADSGRDWDADTPVANLSVHSISWTAGGESHTQDLNGVQQIVNLQHGTLTINPDGSYEYSLNEGANGESDSFTYILEDVHGAVSESPATVTFTMPDSVPTANPDQIVAGTVSSASVNLVFAIDSSGSISDANLGLMKNAITNLMNEYGDSLVKVMLVDFDNNAVVKTGAGGEVWLTAAQATTALESIYSGGETDYDSVLSAIKNSYGDAPEADKTYVYFMSDGHPEGGDGPYWNYNPNTIEDGERSNWVDFLVNKGVSEVYAIGVGSGVTANDPDLLDVAWSSSGNDADNVRLVSSAAELSATLTEIAHQVSGNVVTNDDPGADGIGAPALVSVEFGGTTYHFDQVGDPDHYTLDLGIGKGSLLIEADGDFTYTPPTGGAYGSPVVVNYTMQDGDGSKASSTLTIDPHDLPDAVDDSGVVHLGYFQAHGNVTESASVTTPASWGSAETSSVRGSWSIDPHWSADSETSRSFAINADSSHPASVTVEVDLSGYRSGDVVQVSLLKDGQVVSTKPVSADGSVPFSGLTQSGSYSVRVYGDDNSWGFFVQDGDLQVTIKNISYTDYSYTSASTRTVTVTAPDMQWVAAVAAVGNVILENDDPGIQGAEVVSVDFGGTVYGAGDTITTAYGTLHIDANGAYTYEPSGAEVPAGTVEHFTYTIEQPDGDFDSATLTISFDNHAYVATSGNDVLVAGGAGGVIDGLGGNDHIVGGEGDDVLHGGAGNDYIEGNAGDDQLYGEAGSDFLSGGAGNDTLYGGAGDDILTGGEGRDTFAYAAGDLAGVVHGDIITDFQLGTGGDTLDLSGLLNGAPGGLDKFLEFEVSNIDSVAGTATVAVQVSQHGDGNFASLATIEVSGAAGMDDHAIEAMLKGQIDI